MQVVFTECRCTSALYIICLWNEEIVAPLAEGQYRWSVQNKQSVGRQNPMKGSGCWGSIICFFTLLAFYLSKYEKYNFNAKCNC